MSLYILVFFGSALLGVLLFEGKPIRWAKPVYFTCVSLAIIIPSALRHIEVGIDYHTYYDAFRLIGNEGLAGTMTARLGFSGSYGFRALCWLLSRFGTGQIYYAAAISTLFMVLLCRAVWRQCANPWVGMFVLLGLGFWGYSLCFTRQALAAAILLQALPFLRRRRLVPFLALVLLAASFHFSALLMVPLCLLGWLPCSWKSLAVYGGLTGLFLIFSWPILNFATQYVFSGYADSRYLLGRSFSSAVLPILGGALVFLFRKKLLDRDPSLLPLLNMAVFAGLLYVIGLKHFLFQRSAFCLLISFVVLLPQLVECFDSGWDPASGEADRPEEAPAGEKRTWRSWTESPLFNRWTVLALVLALCVAHGSYRLFANPLHLTPYHTYNAASVYPKPTSQKVS